MIWESGKGWVRAHARVLSYVIGSGLIAAWTVLRFFTQRTIFDLVGQQVLAQQWLHGGIAGAGIGVTNYIPKLFLLYVPLHVLPGSPRLKLLALTILVNVATLVLLGLVLERLLREFGVKVGAALYASLIWLGAIAGSVFWVEFTNSRNLEVVGGLFLLYEGVVYLKRPGRRRWAGIALFGSALFFADTLQLYMTAVPLVLYGLTVGGRKNWRRVGWLGGALVIAFVGSKLLFAASAHLLSIHFLQAGGGTDLSLHFLEQGATGTLKAFVHLYSGGADAGRLREAVNAAFLAAAITAVAYAAVRRLVPGRLLLLVAYVLAIDTVVYVASGEAQQPDTERYLIMTVPTLMLLFGALQGVWRRFRVIGIAVLCVFLAVNCLFLSKALGDANRHRFSQDAHLASVERYLEQTKDTLAYASMDTALPTAYLYGSDAKAPLPLSCSGITLVKDSTFYSRTAYKKYEAQSRHTVAVILDGSAITNVPDVCDEAHIIGQLGQPENATTTDDGSTVLLYSPAVKHSLRY